MVTARLDAPKIRLTWDHYHRLISSAYPPIDLFEDIADPADWLLIGAGDGKTNPRLAQTIGNLDLVPRGRRVSGPGASYVMAPFTHVSPDHPGRFAGCPVLPACRQSRRLVYEKLLIVSVGIGEHRLNRQERAGFLGDA